MGVTQFYESVVLRLMSELNFRRRAQSPQAGITRKDIVILSYFSARNVWLQQQTAEPDWRKQIFENLSHSASGNCSHENSARALLLLIRIRRCHLNERVDSSRFDADATLSARLRGQRCNLVSPRNGNEVYSMYLAQAWRTLQTPPTFCRRQTNLRDMFFSPSRRIPCQCSDLLP